jgi:hypothetical protein
VSDFVAIWPITCRDLDTDTLTGEAIPDLYDLLEAHGLTPAGLPVWSRNVDSLCVRLPVWRDEPAGEDGRPWESLRAWAGEMFDGWAA